MEHIYHNANFGENWFNYADIYARFIKEAPLNAKIVEVGAWKGKSVCFLAVEAINSGKNISIDAIDTWLGSAEHRYLNCNNLYEVFLENIKPVDKVVTPIRMKSVDASKLYADESLDIVFLDAAHDYDSVLEDIKCWLPKVKQGGILAGHDYNDTWLGVVKAVNESFSNFETSGPCWIHYKK